MHRLFQFFLIATLASIAACAPTSKEAASDTVASQDSSALAAADTSLEAKVKRLNAAPAPFDSANYTFKGDAVEVNWQLLAKVEFKDFFNKEADAFVPYPVFHPHIKALNGKTIVVKGYVIPMEETGDETILVLSANPFSQCFFCGNAGPESVMDINLKGDNLPRFKQDQVTAFKGRLRLNDSDLYYLNYILEEAELVKE